MEVGWNFRSGRQGTSLELNETETALPEYVFELKYVSKKQTTTETIYACFV